MRRLLLTFGIVCLLLAGVLFLYGVTKLSQAEQEEKSTINLGDGIEMVQESQSQNFSDKALNMSTFIGIGGVVLLLLSRGMRKQF